MDSTTMEKAGVKKYKKAEFVFNFVVYSAAAFLSCLFYFYLFCFPAPPLSSINHFLSFFAPNDSFLFCPKLLFLIIGNVVIVLFLVGESKRRRGTGHSSPANEIYDEYVRRTRPSLDVAERCPFDIGHDSNMVNCDRGSLVQENPLTRTTMEHKKMKDGKTLDVERNVTTKRITMKMDDEKRMNHPRHAIHAKVPEKKSLVPQDADKVGANVVGVTTTTAREKAGRVQEEGKLGIVGVLPRDDELKRRVEDFIARVNRQRMLETIKFAYSPES